VLNHEQECIDITNMLKLCRVDIERSQEIFEAIARYVNKVARELMPKKIILFGSFDTGDFNEASDDDLTEVITTGKTLYAENG
jgi:predicted nucleotidyltransferase